MLESYEDRNVRLQTRGGVESGDLTPDMVENFKSTVGNVITGYGFNKGETITFDDCEPINEEDKDKGMVIKFYEPYPGAKNMVWVVGVTRTKNILGREVSRRDYLNLNRLTEMDFVSREYIDEFREAMALNFSDVVERLNFLRGRSVKSTGEKKISRYMFDPQKPGEFLIDKTTNQRAIGESTVTTVELVPLPEENPAAE